MEIDKTKESVVKYISKNYNENDLEHQVQETIPDYLDECWEEEFESMEEAYIEQGRGEAEAQVRQEIENDVLGKFKIDYFDFENEVGENLSDIITETFPCLKE